MTSRRLLALVALAVATLSGCLRFSADVTLGEDDTASGRFVVAVKDGSGDTYDMSDRDLAEAIWEDYPRRDALGATHTSSYHRDGYTGVSIAFSDVPLAAFAPTDATWGITRAGDDYVVSGPSNATGGADLGTAPDGGAITGDEDALASAEFTLAVTFPGAVASANGDIEGRTVTWDLQHGPDELAARGSATKAADPAVGVAYVVCGALALGALAYALAGRTRRRER